MNMKRIRLFILCGILAVVMILPAVFASEQDNVLGALNTFYESAKNKDLESYIQIQDKSYLDEIIKGHDISYNDYFRAFFQEITTTDYKIESPLVDLEGNKALVFYTLKSNVVLVSTGEKKSINNDMVAFLWKYDSWKVRYTIPLTLYMLKIESDTINNAAGSLTEYIVFDQSVKQEVIGLGLIEQGFLSDYDVDPENTDKQKRGFPGGWFFVLLIIGFMAVIFNKGLHNNVLKNKDIKKHFKNFGAKAQQVGTKIKPFAEKTAKHARSAYSKAKPKLIKAYNDSSSYLKKNVPVLINNVQKKIVELKDNTKKKWDKKPSKK
jgi:hypothetical protein